MMHTEGLQHFQEVITGQQSVPTDYYIGWCTDTVLLFGDSMTALTELSGNGYERKRIAPVNAKAEGTLTLNQPVYDGDTMTIGAIGYRFKDTPALAEDIEIGTSLEDTQANIVATINGTGTPGVEYYAGTTSPHPTVEIGAFNGDDEAVLKARTAGTGGNSIVTTETFIRDSGGVDCFDAATLGTTRAGGVELTSAAGGIYGRKLTTISLTWTAVGGAWLAAYTVFMTTTATGTAGKLIASEELNGGAGVALANGASYDVAMTLLAEPYISA